MNRAPDFSNRIKRIWVLIKQIWVVVAGAIGAVTAVVEFIKLWRGDQQTVTQVISIGAAILVWISLYYVGFSRITEWMSIVGPLGKELPQRPVRHPRYGEKFSKAAQVLFFIAIGLALALWGIAIRRNLLLDSKVIVAVADFDGPDPKSYRITEKILSGLSQSLSNYNDTVIIPLDETVTEQQGSERARELGQQHHAALVIWGWYGATESDALVTVHIENLSSEHTLPLPTSKISGMQVPIYQLQSFQLQQKLSSHLTSLILFLGGVVRFEAGDYREALDRINQALSGDWPDDLLSRTIGHYYRGEAYYSSAIAVNGLVDPKLLQASVQDLSEVIQANPQFLPAYYTRAYDYLFLDQTDGAEQDFQRVIQSSPQQYFTSKQLGDLAGSLGHIQKAIDYLTEAIKQDPSYEMSWYSRGVSYMENNDYANGLSDLNRAVQLRPNLWLFRLGRADAYMGLKQYDLAMTDLERARQLLPSDEAQAAFYIDYDLGQIYADKQDYGKAVQNFTTALQLAPPITVIYVDRGNAYNNMGLYDKAYQDFTSYIEDGAVDFITPIAYYGRGVASDGLNDTEAALADYSASVQLDAHFASIWHGTEYSGQAQSVCNDAISDFEDVSAKSKDASIIRFSRTVVTAFKAACPPTSLSLPVPGSRWLIALSSNPIVPGVGAAGVIIGEPKDSVIGKLDDAMGWFTLVDSPEPDCCIGAMWGSSDLALTVFFTRTDQKVVSFRLDTLGNAPHPAFMPSVRGVSLGSSESNLLSAWGSPLVSEPSVGKPGCTDYDYDGISFRVCGANRFIDAIELPKIAASSPP